MKSFDETYTMRSRFFQLLGHGADQVAQAFQEGDLENRANIHSMTAMAVRHALVDRHGYTFAELPAPYPDALAEVSGMNAADLAEIAIAVVQRVGQLGRKAGEAIRDRLEDGDADFVEGAGWIEDASDSAI